MGFIDPIRQAAIRRVMARHQVRLAWGTCDHLRQNPEDQKVAKTFELKVGDPVLYGKYKNKKGKIVGFKTEAKSGDPIVVVEPVPKGRKKPKDLKLFKLRYDEARAKAEKSAHSGMVKRIAGMFKPPPVMYDNIREWMLNVYCGHVLALVDKKIVGLLDTLGPAKKALKKMEDVKRSLRQDIKNLRYGETWRTTVSIIEYDNTLRTRVLGVRLDPERFIGSEGFLDFFENPKRPELPPGGEPLFLYGHGEKRLTFKKIRRILKYDKIVNMVFGDLDNAIDILRKQMESISGQRSNTEYKDRTLVDLNLMRSLAQKYTAQAKSYKSRTSKGFPVDLSGWGYIRPSSPFLKMRNEANEAGNNHIREKIEHGRKELKAAQALVNLIQKAKGDLREESVLRARDALGVLGSKQGGLYWHMGRIEKGEKPNKVMVNLRGEWVTEDKAKSLIREKLGPDQINEALAGSFWKTVTCILDFQGHLARGGQWSVSKRELQVDVFDRMPQNMERFEEGIRGIENTLRHELQHVGQDILRDVLALPEKAGLPSQNVRNLEYNPYGAKRDAPWGSGRKDHALQDVEFYTRLADDISEFVKRIKTVPRTQWQEAAHRWVDGERLPGLSGSYSDFFEHLKKSEPKKWQKAVKEFFSGIEKELGSLGRGPSKVRTASLNPPQMSRVVPGYPTIRQTTHDGDGVPIKDEANFLQTRPRFGISLAAVPRGDADKDLKQHEDLIDAIQTGRPMEMPSARTGSTKKGRDLFAESLLRVAARYQKKKQVPKAEGSGTTTVYEYSDRQVKDRHREKAKRIEKLRGVIDKLRSQVQKDLKSKDEEKRLTALAIGLMDATYERVGNVESAEEGHYGVTGWLVKHVTFGKGKATIKYVGKSGVKHKKVIDDKDLVAALKKATKGKDGKDPICVSDDAKATASDVNEYLKSFNITAKDIRGLHANTEIQTRLKVIRAKGGKLSEDKKKREKQLKAEFKKALEEAADAVGHEPATLKSQYLVPGLEDAFLKDGTVTESLTKKGHLSTGRRFKFAAMSRVQYHATSWARVPSIMQKGLQLPRGPQDVSTFAHAIPSISTADKPEYARAYHPHGALLELRVRPGAKYLKRSARQMKRGETLLDAVNRWSKEVQAKGAAGFWMDGWQSTVGNQTFDPRALEFVRVVNADEAPPGIKIATKSKSEKEDEEVERMSRPKPSKKPPRQDLRRNRIEVEDSDTESQGADKDKDLSLNYKRIASKIAAQWSRRRAGDDRLMMLVAGLVSSGDKKKEGDYWQVEESGTWYAWPPEADGPVPAEDEADAKAKSRGGEKAPEEPVQEKGPEDKDKELRKQKRQLRRDVGKVEEVVNSLSGQIEDSEINDISEVYSELSLKERAALAKEYKVQLELLSDAITDKGLRASTIRQSEKALKNPLQGFTEADPIQKGKMLAEWVFADRVVANPSVVGGQAISNVKKSDEELVGRAYQAYRQFGSGNEAVRKRATQKAFEQLEELDPKSLKYTELNRIVDGLALAAAIQGEALTVVTGVEFVVNEDGDQQIKEVEKELRPKPPKAFQDLAKKMKDLGEGKILLESPGVFYGPKGRGQVKKALSKMDDPGLAKFIGEDSPWSPVAALLDGGKLGPAQAKFARQFLIGRAAKDMIQTEKLVRELSETSTFDMDQLMLEIKKGMAQEPEIKALRDELLECGLNPDKCPEGRISKIEKELDRKVSCFYTEYVEKNVDMPSGKIPVEFARHKHICQTGDVSISDEVLHRSDKKAF